MEDWSYKLREFWNEADTELRAALLVGLLSLVAIVLEKVGPPPIHRIRIVE